VSAASARGFVLTPTHRVVDGRPEVRLYAVLEDGTPALLVDDRQEAYFFVRTAEAERVRGARVRDAGGLTTFSGDPVSRVAVASPSDVRPLRHRLMDLGVECFEADVRFAYRYLIDRGVRGSFRVRGRSTSHPRLGRVYRNAHLEGDGWTPTLRVLSFDIETSPDAGRLYSIACAGAGGERVFLVYDRPVVGAQVLSDERACLDAFLAHVRTADPDVLTGWNVGDFDLPVLRRLCRAAGLRCALGRAEDEIDFQRDQSFTRESRVILLGRVVLDGLALVRSSYLRLDDYRLETAAQVVLGRGKLFGPDQRGSEIEHAYRHDPEALVAYNLEDARLVLEILTRLDLIELTVRRSLATGMQLDRVGAQIAAIDSLYLGALRARGRVAPSVSVARGEDVAIGGGLVLDSAPGLYRNILVFDFRSLYPSLIRTFNIDPLTHVPASRDDVPAHSTPSGARFRADEVGILPELVARFWDERSAATAAGDAIGAQALKILMNSMFGVLGSPASRLFSPAVANAITGAGRHVIDLAARFVAGYGHTVIYGDTDSVFVDAGAESEAAATRLGEALREQIEREVGERLAADYGCASSLQLEFEKVYRRFFMPEVRGGKGGSKKRYAGMVGDRLEIVGLEAVRRDWSGVARRFQRELLLKIFRDEPVRDFVAAFVRAVYAGDFDDELVYRKAVRKPLDQYTRTTPPHVKAARKAGAGDARIVRYVMTRAGPEPVDGLTASPDYDHYVTQQLQPLADAVLRFVPGVDFDEVAGLRRQLSLF